MAFAWSLPTGFNTPITYFYFVYFAVLLIHRQRRDDEACAIKYENFFFSILSLGTNRFLIYRHGDDWETYKKIVPYRIIPYIY